MSKIIVTPEVLIWARERRKLTPKQAAKLLRIDAEKLLAYESGKASPTITHFKKLAKIYYLPESTLWLDKPPLESLPPPKDYRTIPGYPAELSYEASVVISRVRFYQGRLAELAELDDAEFAIPDFPKYSLQTNPSLLGEAERKRLGIDAKTQLGWSNEDEAFRRWRQAIEELGISVFMEKMPWPDYKGVSLYDKNHPPAVIINKNEILTVGKIFSLLHEYAHILIRHPGISDREYVNNVEAFCNRFAGGFLMPRSVLESALPFWPTQETEWEKKDIQEVAAKLKVSQQALALRLEHLGLAPAGFFNRFKEQQNKMPKLKKDKKSIKIDYTILRIYDLGRRFPRMILSAQQRGIIGQVDAAHILNIPQHLFKRMRERLGA